MIQIITSGRHEACTHSVGEVVVRVTDDSFKSAIAFTKRIAAMKMLEHLQQCGDVSPDEKALLKDPDVATEVISATGYLQSKISCQ